MKIAWIIFLREWRETIRDRRTILVMVMVPLLFYPLSMGVMGYFGAKQQVELEVRPLAVGVDLEKGNELLEIESFGEGLAFQQKPDLEPKLSLLEGRFDLILERLPPADDRESQKLVVHYRDTIEGASALSRFEAALEAYEAEVVRRRFVALGEDVSAADPVLVEKINHAPIRESAGSRFGGIFGYLLIFLGFTGCLATAVDTGAGEKERGVFEAMLVTSVNRGALVLGKWAFVFSAGLLSIVSSLGGLGILAVLGWVGGGMPEIGGVLIFALQMISMTVLSLLFTSSLLLGVSLLAENTKQAQSMTTPLFLAVSLILIFALLPGTELSATTGLVPILSAALAIREAVSGSLGISEFAIVTLSHLFLASGWMYWILRRVKAEGRLLGE